MLKYTPHQFCFLSLLISGMFLLSCRKEYVSMPYNNIEQFIITDTEGNELKASVTGNSIILYWPPFQPVPGHIKPVISISEGAKINPASGAEVPFDENTVYTVTAQDGSTKTYQLKTAINQPAPVFEIVGSDFLTLGSTINLSGQYFIPDTTQTRLYMVNSANTDIPVSLKDADKLWSNRILVKIPLDGRLDTGYYQVKVVSGRNTTVKGPYHIGQPLALDIDDTYSFNEAGQTIKKGAEISFTYSMPAAAGKYFYGKFIRADIIITGDPSNGIYPAAVTSQDQTLLKFRLPADIPSGNIASVTLYTGEDAASPGGTFMYTWQQNSGTPTIITE